MYICTSIITSDNEERLKMRSDQMKIIILRTPINSINEAH